MLLSLVSSGWIRKKEKQKGEVRHKYKVGLFRNKMYFKHKINSYWITWRCLIKKKCLKAYKIHFKHRINTRTKKGVVGRYNGELWVWRHLWCGRNNCVVCVCLPSLRDVVWPCSEWIHYVNLHLVILHFVNFTFGPPYIWSTVTKRQLLWSYHYIWPVF